MTIEVSCRPPDSPLVDGNPESKKQREYTLVTTVVLLLASVWSIAVTGYDYGTGDPAWQSTMVMHIMRPELLNRDPLITEVATQYQSLLFPLLAAFANCTSLFFAYAASFAVVRVATVFALYHLVYVCISNRHTSLMTTVFVTGMSCTYGYLGAMSLLDAYFVPRNVALVFVFLAMVSMIQGKYIWNTVWLCLTFLFHPVTGVNLFGVYFLFNIFDWRQLRWRPFLLSCLAVACLIAGFAVRFIAAGGGDMFIDSEWRAAIDRYVSGRYIFLWPYAWTIAKMFWKVMVAGTIMAAILRFRPIASPLYRFIVAGLAAMAVHYIGVDCLGIVPLAQAVPARATIPCIVMAAIAMGAFIAFLWTRGTLVSRSVASLLFLDQFFCLPNSTIIFIGAIAVGWFQQNKSPVDNRTISVWRGIFLPVVASSVVLAIASFGLLRQRITAVKAGTSNNFCGLSELANMGIPSRGNALDKIYVQRWIRDHSDINDMIFPPSGIKSTIAKWDPNDTTNVEWQRAQFFESSGWEIVSERACTFHGALYTYVHLSHSFGMRYKDFVERIPQGPKASWNDMIRFAKGYGADWVVIDDRYYPHRDGDPKPDFSAGVYHVVKIPRQSKNTSSLRPSLSGGEK